jgi:hypothetical protein
MKQKKGQALYFDLDYFRVEIYFLEMLDIAID